MINPAQQRINNHHDYRDGHAKKQHSALIAINVRAERNDADQTEQEGADESRQRVLSRGVLHDQQCLAAYRRFSYV